MQEYLDNPCIIFYMSKLLCTFIQNLHLLSMITEDNYSFYIFQYPQDKNKGAKIPVQLRVNIWLGLTAAEKKFNSFAEGTFSVSAEMVNKKLCLLMLNILLLHETLSLTLECTDILT